MPEIAPPTDNTISTSSIIKFKNLFTIAEFVAPAIIFSNFLSLIFDRIFLPK